MFDELKVMDEVRRQYRLSLDGIHGPAHWARVYLNGLELLEAVCVPAKYQEKFSAAVRAFAMVHDACRWDDGPDFGHGRRAKQFATLRIGRQMLGLDYKTFEAMLYAVDHHNGSPAIQDVPRLPTLFENHRTLIGICWDADRLDLDRVGVMPDKRLLMIQDDAVINSCRSRSRAGAIPRRLLKQWGCDSTICHAEATI